MVVTVAHDTRPERLLASVHAYLPPTAPLSTVLTTWGSVVLADTPFAQVGRWLVAGVPQADPWGIPGADLSPAAVATELERLGPSAIQLASGPLLAIDLSNGAVVRAANGIVPLTVSSTGPWVASTAAIVAEALSGHPCRHLPAGAMARPDGADTMPGGTIVADHVPGITWRGIDAELTAKLAALGRMPVVPLAEGPGIAEEASQRQVRMAPIPGRAVFVPRLARGGTLSSYVHLRDRVVPQLWWRARLAGLWLCAPAFERPAAELVSFVVGMSIATDGAQ